MQTMPNPPSLPRPARPYHTYLVRLWQDDQQMTWRAMVQSVQTGEQIHFADLEALFGGYWRSGG
jgi:hypothetical protein